MCADWFCDDHHDDDDGGGGKCFIPHTFLIDLFAQLFADETAAYHMPKHLS